MEFIFRPASVYWGGALTGLGLLACLALTLFGWWRGLFREAAEPKIEPARDVLPVPHAAD
jgi:hypothetical protein